MHLVAVPPSHLAKKIGNLNDTLERETSQMGQEKNDMWFSKVSSFVSLQSNWFPPTFPTPPPAAESLKQVLDITQLFLLRLLLPNPSAGDLGQQSPDEPLYSQRAKFVLATMRWNSLSEELKAYLQNQMNHLLTKHCDKDKLHRSQRVLGYRCQ